MSRAQSTVVLCSHSLTSPSYYMSSSSLVDRYRLYIKKAESFYGVTRTREIHEAAIKALSDKDAQAMALDYASLERKLGEVDRARAIYAHGAQLDYPKRAPDFWKQWHEFEVAVGNEDTFRDMMRVKRAVLTSFANETFYDMRDSEAPVVSDAEAVAKAGTQVALLFLRAPLVCGLS